MVVSTGCMTQWSFDGLPENNWEAYSYSELLHFDLAGKACTWTAHVYSTDPGPPSPTLPPPTTPAPPTPTPPTPPAPPTPPSQHDVCDPGATGGCTVCGTSCKSYLKDQGDCDACVQTECPAVCDPTVGCSVCASCCKSYLENQDDCVCTACAHAECKHSLFSNY